MEIFAKGGGVGKTCARDTTSRGVKGVRINEDAMQKFALQLFKI